VSELPSHKGECIREVAENEHAVVHTPVAGLARAEVSEPREGAWCVTPFWLS